MSAKVDALFSGEPPQSVLLRPVIWRLRVLLAVSLPMNLLGALCWTGVPGGLLTLWAWTIADREAAVVDTGLVTGAEAAALLRLRRWAAYNLGICVISLLVQVTLLTTSFYEGLLARFLDLLP